MSICTALSMCFFKKPSGSRPAASWRSRVADQINNAPTWTTKIHGNAGNLLLGDGSVQQLTSVGLQKQAVASDMVNDNNHTRIPQ